MATTSQQAAGDRATTVARKRRFDEALDVWRERDEYLSSLPYDDQARNDAAVDAKCAAENAIFALPCETIHDLRAKLELIFIDPDVVSGPEIVAGLFKDVRTLDGGASSPTFNAGAWLRHFEYMGGGWIERDGDIVLMVPEGRAVDYSMWMLETRDGRKAVHNLIRQRIAERRAS